MAQTKTILPEQKPYKIDGEHATHAKAIERHVAAIGGDLEAYDSRKCTGLLIFHGDRVADEHGEVVPHWVGSAMFRDVVCVECGDTWSVETEYRRKLLREKDEGPAVTW